MSHDNSAEELLWPAESVRLALLELNRNFLRNHPNPLLRGRESWPNQQPELYPEELAIAQSSGIVPISPGEPQFRALMASGERFNWAILLSGELRVTVSIVVSGSGPVRISHAILARDGGDVLAAGEGKARGYLSNTTGHYKNEPFVVAPVKEAFAKIGITFKS